MTDSNALLLIAIVPEPLRDTVVDTLMAIPFITGFTSIAVQGFSQQNHKFNPIEQVQGFQNMHKFEVLHDATNSNALLQTFRDIRSQESLHYWITPVLESGNLAVVSN
jgi:hypothetical protein